MKGPAQSPSPDIDQAAAKWIARRDAGWTAAEQAECERWRTADARHAQALAKYDHTWVLFDRPRAMGGAEVMWQELGARTQKRRVRRIRMALTGTAALVAAGFVAQIYQPWRTAVPPTSSAQAIVHAPEKRTLPDGSVVELKEGASISVDFAGRLRRITLRRGEAYFEVAPSTERPFVVNVGELDVRAVGTAFSVQLGAETVEVLVTHGRIAVETTPPAGNVASVSGPAPAAAGPLAVVDGGNRVRVDLVDGKVLPHVVEAVAMTEAELAERLAWRAPRLEFSGTPLAEAVALLNQHSRLQLALDPGLAHIELSGFFRADNTEAFLRVLEGTFGITGERSGDTIVLRPAR